jgi:hypothetical protein
MTTAAPFAAFVTIQPASTDAERLTLAGFLGGYRGLTRDHPPRPSAVRGWTTSATPLRLPSIRWCSRRMRHARGGFLRVKDSTCRISP